jgi:argininosuccinate lyase
MRKILYALTLAAVVHSSFAAAAEKPPRDEFFWLGMINKATIVINSEEGLLDKALTPKIAAGLVTVHSSRCLSKRPGPKSL